MHMKVWSTMINHPRDDRTGSQVRSKLKILEICQEERCFSYLKLQMLQSRFTGLIISPLCSSHACRQRAHLTLEIEHAHILPQRTEHIWTLVGTLWSRLILKVFFCQDLVIFLSTLKNLPLTSNRAIHLPLPLSTLSNFPLLSLPSHSVSKKITSHSPQFWQLIGLIFICSSALLLRNNH